MNNKFPSNNNELKMTYVQWTAEYNELLNNHDLLMPLCDWSKQGVIWEGILTVIGKG